MKIIIMFLYPILFMCIYFLNILIFFLLSLFISKILCVNPEIENADLSCY